MIELKRTAELSDFWASRAASALNQDTDLDIPKSRHRHRSVIQFVWAKEQRQGQKNGAVMSKHLILGINRFEPYPEKE